VQTRRDDVVQLELREQDGADRVVVLERSPSRSARQAKGTKAKARRSKGAR
jgi:hypothetical protein